MAAEPFNSLSGYTVGIPAVTVIDNNGNVVTNFVNLSGLVSANTVYANNYYWANGIPFNTNPGGLNTQLQYNNNGSLGGIPNVTFNGNILNLGDISKLSIGGGDNGYFLQTDGLGNLTWAAGGGGGGNGSPAGSNTQIQFNNQSDFGASANLTFDSSTNLLNLVGNITVGNANLGNVATANYFVSSAGSMTLGNGIIGVIGNAAGIFSSVITDINLGLTANVVIGSTTGQVTARNNLVVNNNINANTIQVNDVYSKRPAITVTTNTVIDSFAISEYRSAKYTIKVSDNTGYQALEVLLVHNNINSIITVYGSLSMTGLDLVTLTTEINGSNVELKATGLNANTSVNLMGTYVPD
jgi:hypothetical protein